MSTAKNEERGVSAALGKIPQVNNQRAFSCTITIAGTGLGDISVQDIGAAILSQHLLIDAAENIYDQLYVHRVRAFGTAGGYLSIAPYPHRFNVAVDTTDGDGQLWNSYEPQNSTANTFRSGSLQQMYEFGINGASRPELNFEWPTAEVVNNPFIVNPQRVENSDDPSTTKKYLSRQKLLTIQSTNTAGNALYIVQFDVTIRNSEFIEIIPSLGAAAFGERNVLVDNYKPPFDLDKRKEEGEKAHELANKKRKVENVKALTMPALDSH